MSSGNHTYPNLFLAGFPKCGTTSLYNYLVEHPDIYGPALKEPRYLAYENVKDGQKSMFRRMTVKDEKTYIALYKDGSGFRYRLDGSPEYAYKPNVVEKIGSMEDDTKVIVTIRNPADRVISLYNMQWNRGRTDKNLQEFFLDRKASGTHKGNPTFYHDGIKNMYDILGRGRVHVMVFEEWTKNTETELKKLYDFLEIEHILPENIDKAYFSNKNVMKNNILRHIKTGLWARWLYPLMNDRMRRFGRKFFQNKRLYTEHEVSADLKRAIHEHYMDDIILTEELTGLDLSSWKTVW